MMVDIFWIFAKILHRREQMFQLTREIEAIDQQVAENARYMVAHEYNHHASIGQMYTNSHLLGEIRYGDCVSLDDFRTKNMEVRNLMKQNLAQWALRDIMYKEKKATNKQRDELVNRIHRENITKWVSILQKLRELGILISKELALYDKIWPASEALRHNARAIRRSD